MKLDPKPCKHRSILLLISSLDGGGAERVATTLCNHWHSDGNRVEVLLTKATIPISAYRLNSSIPITCLRSDSKNIRPTLFAKAQSVLKLRRVIKRINPDVIVSFLFDVNIAGILACVGLNIPFIACERTHPPSTRAPYLGKLARQLTYPRASKVIVMARGTHEWMRRFVNESKIEAIPNPVCYPLEPGNGEIIPPELVIGPKCKVLLACGRLHAVKGHVLLLKAFSCIKPLFPTWELVILGEGPERARLEREIEALGLCGAVHLPGWASNLTAWYERADLFVLSSIYEGFPNALLEAMAHGLPAVSMDCPAGPRDIIRHGVDGYLVAPESSYDGLAQCLTSLMSDVSLLNKMGSNAFDVRKRYNAMKIMRRWDSVLDTFKID